ncbi:HEX1 [Candida margitis]|uniref:HEX1 n=1 Tax=Candida margitis TaxID=1775924 RepID=UPI0022262C30|nr:HEX1 [Candida margitis]KAI5968030.1 HEX1 [Candida margitis]
MYRAHSICFTRSFFGSAKPQTYSITRVLNGTPQQLYKIVSEVNNYKNFVPFVEDSFVSSRDVQQQPSKAGLKVGWKDITEKFECSLTCKENETVHARSIELDLFHELETEWKFKNASGNKCRRMVENVRSAKWSPYVYNSDSILFDLYSQMASPVIHVEISDYEADLQLGVAESYDLEASENGITISSETVWGTLHALTTLQQLIIYKHDRFMLERSVSIRDYPQFPHRGIMIDSARNFLPVESILQQIDIMSHVKMNSLHWHLVDTQSWPLVLKCHPEMSRDAYSEQERYTINDLKRVQSYGRERGVRVIPEIDMPGHARAGWRQVDSSLIKCGNKFWNGYAVEPPPGQLNIANNKTYQTIHDIYSELSEAFADDFFHVGNDELQKSCYPQDWFENQTLSDVTGKYLDSVLPIFNNRKGRRLIMWDDVLTSEGAVKELPLNITLQVWHEPSHIKNLTRKGYNVIVSSADHLYLDCGYGGFLTNDFRYSDSPENGGFNGGKGGSWCNPYKTWQRIYSFDFLSDLTDSEKGRVLGAEAVLWSEQVDFTVLTGKLWPRSAALAESLWSGNRNEKGLEFSGNAGFEQCLLGLSDLVKQSSNLKVQSLAVVEPALAYVPQNEVEQLRVYRGVLLTIRNLAPSLNIEFFPLVIQSFQRFTQLEVNEWVLKLRLVYWEILANFQRNNFTEEIDYLFTWGDLSFKSPIIHFLFRQFFTEDPEVTNETLLHLLKIRQNHVLNEVHKLYLEVDFENVDHDSKMLIHLLYDIITHESFANWIDQQDEETKIQWLQLATVVVQTKDDWNNFQLVGLLVWAEQIFSKTSDTLRKVSFGPEPKEPTICGRFRGKKDGR